MPKIMPTLKCDNCETALNTAHELASTLCESCRTELERKDTYAGVCWHCGRITLIQEIPRQLKGILTEKYLFTKACSHCTGFDGDDIAWITVKTYQPDFKWVISGDGELCRIKVSRKKGPKGDRPRKAVPSTDERISTPGGDGAASENVKKEN